MPSSSHHLTSTGPTRKALLADSILAALLAGLLAGCTGAAPPVATTSNAETRSAAGSPVTGPAITWTRTELPEGSSPLTLTILGDRLIVGATVPVAGPDVSHPRMYAVDAAGRATPVRLTPSSPYAFLARWSSVATDGAQVVAIGGATGGAHGNVRWSTWSGTSAGLREQTQNFLTFGGEDAGQLIDVVLTPQGPVIVGTWAGAVTGQDAAIWLRDNDIWRRQNSRGTALQSTPTELVGPRAATSSGSGVVIVGSTVHLGSGPVTQSASLWRSTGPDTGWHRVDLPGAGRTSEAVSVRCDGPRCLVAGRVDGVLTLWEALGDNVTRLTGTPALAVSDHDLLPAPVSWAGHDTVVAPAGGRAMVLTRTTDGWATSPGPAGMPATAAAVGGRLWVTTVPTMDAPATLWRSTG